MNRSKESIMEYDLFRSVIDNSHCGIMALEPVRDDSGEIMDFKWWLTNKVAEEIMGFSSEELIGNHLLEVMPGYKEAGIFREYLRVVETGEPRHFEQFYTGEHFRNWFKMSVSKLFDGLIVSFSDITKFRDSIIQLEESESKYRRLFEESMNPIFLANNELLIIDANESMKKLFGFTKEDLSSRTLKDLFADEQDFNEFNRQLYKRGIIHEFEALMCGRQGEMCCIINLGQQVDKEKGIATIYHGVIRDMSNRKKAEAELIMAEKLSMTGKLARSIAHEIRNPLTNLMLALEQLKDEVSGPTGSPTGSPAGSPAGSSAEDVDFYLNIIRRNADRISHLISELLDSAKPKELVMGPYPINKVVEESVDLIRDQAKLQNIVLAEEYDTADPVISLDPDQMRVALFNLLINAMEAVKPDEGRLVVTTKCEPHKLILMVSDNGPGISKENLSRLFEPFFTRKKEGMGLGLITVQNIIHGHNGKIKVESEMGKGTRFIITFDL